MPPPGVSTSHRTALTELVAIGVEHSIQVIFCQRELRRRQSRFPGCQGRQYRHPTMYPTVTCRALPSPGKLSGETARWWFQAYPLCAVWFVMALISASTSLLLRLRYDA